MIGLIQRVSEANVTVAGEVIGEIGKGMLVLLGVEKEDGDAEIEKLANKLCRYRMFSDEDGKMNLNIEQVGGEILVVSQFTLVADTQKGNRPGFSRGATPEHGEAIYKKFVHALKAKGMAVSTGEFGADMQVGLVNDGPVTFQFNV
ncbi:D-aminoacyl-tRNA deacylase [Alteromonas mediterranea]|uniref:D-aminoacyl-tRNA deacylase n=1 Tax=Alteromonas mediterranea TaxID=314275 RepID=A0AAC8XNJ0_9ALTE|nr:D-aminoacyl-tRNA deacylase [Alteromonas mediterranea]AFV87143.1 D-tyrosyl-tRNA(Tyr) deacylase [Alteromonas mediterranea DE1]AGP83392.1 D-tyrosyl-tRNA(Tyr) deacylase [Alteromonas mediterranea MED64]AGP99158.1 D-tyrosyl-tRNA(Tyr) deacylase [Alteromonas mediterranea UM7]AGQ03331.1 D-tyrosyl-tRNA(Tyr) deacylase [Alteromonas mediterranea UM4b]AMJ80054.1 D-tyrosyl-tRNA(Tyr) deacylase [Alteromonas mediterranea]